MANRHASIVDQVKAMVRDGTIPQPECVNCGKPHSKRRSLFAVCSRVTRRWENDGSVEFIAGLIAWIPFVLPIGSGNVVEVREGEDLVVPVPVHVCDTCWNRVDGGVVYFALAIVSQYLCLAGAIATAIWLFNEWKGDGISLFWIIGCFGLALPFYVAAELVRAYLGHQPEVYLRKVDEYRELLTVYPGAEIVTSEPVKLTSGSESS